MSTTDGASLSDSLEFSKVMSRGRKDDLALSRSPVVSENKPGESLSYSTANTRLSRRWKVIWISIVIAAILTGIVIPISFSMSSSSPGRPEQSIPYLGLYDRGMPASYDGVSEFTTVTGVRPNVLMYYSSWNEPFQESFADTATKHGAIPLVQINPYGISLSAIASGQYDGYLAGYANAVRSYRRPVILSLGHEMNGHWYPWGYTRTSPAVFVEAWRHVVSLFRGLGARNVTWMWTVNIMDKAGGIPSPGPWWPGSAYVNWVGIDGYYYNSSTTFASLFGPTIALVRELTGDPILIAETGATSAVGQPAKISDLFAGIRLYGLLGFVWFSVADYSIVSPSAVAAFHQGAAAYQGPSS